MRAASRPILRLHTHRGRLVCLVRLPRPAGPRTLAFILGPAAPHLRRLALLPGGDRPERPAAA